MGDRVCVLYNAVGAGADLDARDVLDQVEAVSAALESLGHAPLPLAVGLDLERARCALGELRPDWVFNLAEDLDGHAELIAAVPMLLEALGLTYTGASADAMLLTSNKVLAKRWLVTHRLPTPPWLDEGGAHGDVSRKGRWIVKPVWEDASVGLDDASVVSGLDAARTRLAERRARGGTWFAERYVEGREVNVALLADGGDVQVLPIAEIRFVGFPPGKPRIVGYDAKWRAGSFEYENTPRNFGLARSEPALAARIETLARACWDAFGLRGYARVDMRIDERGDPWILEINANTCLSPDAGFAAALEQAGIPYADAIERIASARALGRSDATDAVRTSSTAASPASAR